MKWEKFYKQLSLVNLIIIAIGCSFFNMLTEPSFTSSFLLGALIMLVNFHVMQKRISSLFKNNIFLGNQLKITLNFYLRLAIIGIIVYILLDKGVNPVALLTGFSVVNVGIIMMGIIYAIKFHRRSQ